MQSAVYHVSSLNASYMCFWFWTSGHSPCTQKEFLLCVFLNVPRKPMHRLSSNYKHYNIQLHKYSSVNKLVQSLWKVWIFSIASNIFCVMLHVDLTPNKFESLVYYIQKKEWQDNTLVMQSKFNKTVVFGINCTIRIQRIWNRTKITFDHKQYSRTLFQTKVIQLSRSYSI